MVTGRMANRRILGNGIQTIFEATELGFVLNNKNGDRTKHLELEEVPDLPRVVTLE